MDKKALRRLGKEILVNLSGEEREAVTEKLANQLFESTLWKEANTIGVTVSAGFELDTAPIIEQGWKDGKAIAVPKCIPNLRQLDFYGLENFEQLEDSFYSLREPNPELTEIIDKQEIDLLIVPGLIYDKRGFRVGFGGGYYDRFLVDYPNKTISIFYSKQLTDEAPNETFDIPVQHLLTEKGFV